MKSKYSSAIAAVTALFAFAGSASAQHALVRQAALTRAGETTQAVTYHPLLSRDRIVAVVRARHIRFVGTPYLYNGRYLMRCYANDGQLGYCQVDPYSGAFIGVDLRLES
jgi:hypothetical protein